MTQNNRNDQVLKAERALHDQYNLLPRSQLVPCLGILSFCMLISFIDQNGISITQPTIAKDLDASATISWAGTSSLIANTTFQMLYGRLSDIFGRKAVFLGAVALLAIADLLCGLSQNPAMFYVFRGVSGIGSGGIANIAMIIVSDVVTLEERGKYQGIFGTMVGLGNLIGPFLAAAFIKRSTWRAFFYMLAPLGAIAGVVSYLFLANTPPTATFKESAARIDYGGSFTISLGIILLLIPISGGGAYFDWNSPMVISMLAIGSLSCLLFLLIEWKIAKLPMMPVTIFANKEVVILLIHSFLFGAVYQSYIYYLPLYLLNARQFEVLEAAAISTALFTFQAVFSTLSGLYISHFNRYGEVIWFGFATWTLGAGLCLTFDRDTSPGAIIGPLMVIGVGVGCIFQPTLVALQAHSPKSRRAVIISNRNFFRCCGGAVGLAISAAILQAALRSKLPAEYAYLADSTYALPTDLEPGPSAERVYDAYMNASHTVFLMQVPMIGVSLIGCLFIRDQGLEARVETNHGEEEPQGTMLGSQDNTPKVS
ncbi:MFS domain-containing protein [Fusarium sp. Ph1]|nr:MFS domain-containing protein [Fusarium sp. Ph1]